MIEKIEEYMQSKYFEKKDFKKLDLKISEETLFNIVYYMINVLSGQKNKKFKAIA